MCASFTRFVKHNINSGNLTAHPVNWKSYIFYTVSKEEKKKIKDSGLRKRKKGKNGKVVED